jgi:hypothetical protein
VIRAAPGTGIYITGANPAYAQRVVGNAVFAATPLSGGQQSNNLTDTYAAASTYLNNHGGLGIGSRPLLEDRPTSLPANLLICLFLIC